MNLLRILKNFKNEVHTFLARWQLSRLCSSSQGIVFPLVMFFSVIWEGLFTKDGISFELTNVPKN